MNLDDAHVLTIAQPWAGAIACPDLDLRKGVENRSWGTSWRGPLLVHAGKRWSLRGADDPRVRRALDAGLIRPAATGIVAVATLEDVHPDGGCCRPWGESSYVEAGGRRRRSIFHWVLADVVVLGEPVPYVGHLGLRTASPDVVAAVRAALPETVPA